MRSLAPAALFVDVGANLGFFSVYAAVRGARVVAFEPLLANAALLNASLCLNGLEGHVTLRAVAAASVGSPRRS